MTLLVSWSGFWFTWAILASISAAALAECNRKFRLESRLLNAWRSSFAAAFVLLSVSLMAWPQLTNVKFYAVAGLDGVVNAIGMAALLALAARKSGRVMSMMLPVAAIGAYATWWLINPHARPALVEQPMQVIIAVFSLLTIFLALQRIRANDNSWQGFIIVLPIGLAFGILDALTNIVLQDFAVGKSGNGGIYGVSLAFTFLSALLCAIVAWMTALPTPVGGRLTGFFDRNMLWGGFWSGFWTAGMYLGLTFSLSLAPNPAFPGIIMALTPVWLFVLNQLRHTPDDASPIPSFLIILAAVGLLLSTL